MGPPVNLVSTVLMIGASVYLWGNNKSLRAAIEHKQLKQSSSNVSLCESNLHTLVKDVSYLHAKMEACEADIVGNTKDIRTLAFIKGMNRNKGRSIMKLEEIEIESKRDKARSELQEKRGYADELRNKLNSLQSELKNAQINVEATRSEIIKFKEEINSLV